MTGLSIVTIALALLGVFATFWWLVEWTGGAAGSALSVCRSIQSGFDGWRAVQDDPPGAIADTSDLGPPPRPDDAGRRSDPGFTVPVQVVRARPLFR